MIVMALPPPRTAAGETADLEHCVSLLVDGKPHESCCCRDADECFEAADRATVKLIEMGVPRRERILRLTGQWAEKERS